MQTDIFNQTDVPPDTISIMKKESWTSTLLNIERLKEKSQRCSAKCQAILSELEGEILELEDAIDTMDPIFDLL